MSVPASQRPQSKAEFVIRARDLLIYSIKKSKGLEKSLTFFGKQSLYETAQKIHEDVVRGNSIYPTCKEDVLARHIHFRDARAGLYHLIHLTGKIVRKPCRKAVTRQRRRIKKLFKKVEEGKLSLNDVQQSYLSHRAYLKGFTAYRTRQAEDRLFKSLWRKYASQIKK